LADQGAKAFKDRAYDLAQRLVESGKGLEEFRARVDLLLEDWQSGIDVPTRQRFSSPRLQELIRLPAQSPRASAPQRSSEANERAPRTRLRVTFNDGTVIEEHQAADTLAIVLSRLGLPRIESLGITVRKLPLVGDTKSNRYGQRRIDGRYITTHSSTEEKRETLAYVAEKLGTPLDIQIIENV
jgi:hypothetical protein